MKKIYKHLFLLMALLSLGNILWANDTIRFTWLGDATSKSFIIKATSTKSFSIDWGDNDITTYTGTSSFIYPNHIYPNKDSLYTVTISATDTNCIFTYLNVFGLRLTTLDVSQSPSLTALYCYSNQIKTLDLSKNNSLTTLYCYSNAISFADLYVASQKVSNYSGKQFGTQTMDFAKVDTNVDIPIDTVFYGVGTLLAVSKVEGYAASGIDYTFVNGKIKFLLPNVYIVTMSNSEISSHYTNPAKIMATYAVGDVEKQEIMLNWIAGISEKTLSIQATSEKSFIVDWGDDSVDLYVGNGSTNITPKHTYKNANTYTVTIKGLTEDCFITNLLINAQSITSLNITKNTSLTSLNCDDNYIKALDLSKNTVLTKLECQHNAISLLDLYLASQKISNISNKSLGTQILATADVALNIEVWIDSVFNGINTKFTVLKWDNTASLGKDYMITNGKIKFLTSGIYTVTITNPAIISNNGSPGIVIATFTAGGIPMAYPKIAFTWKGRTSADFEFRAGLGKTVTVNWGDDSVNTYTGLGSNTNIIPKYAYKDTLYHTVTITGNYDCDITRLEVSNRQLIDLDVTKCPSIIRLLFNNNKITEIDLTNNNAISSLQSNGNAISWAGLYALSERVEGAINKFLGTQSLPATPVELNTNIPLDTIFNGVSTTFSITKNGGTATKNIDYVLTDGYIKFITMGTYSITMSNPAIISYSTFPGKVVATYVAGDVGNQEIVLNWIAGTSEKSLSIQASPGKSFAINWGDDSTNVYEGKGTTSVTPKHTYKNANTYTVTIKGLTKDCFITYFTVLNQAVTDLDISKNQSLVNLNCDGNLLKALDISKNTLSYLSCYYNAFSLETLNKLSVTLTSPSSSKLGTQHQYHDSVALNEERYIDTAFKGANTKFVVSRSGSVAVNGTDYTLTGGKIKFLTTGIYKVGMSNPAIISRSDATPISIGTYFVGNIPPENYTKMSFTWKMINGSKSFTFRAAYGKSFRIDWGDDSVNTYVGQGYGNDMNLSHSYRDTNYCTVAISAIDWNSDFFTLDVSSKTVKSIDVSNSIAIERLFFNYNQIEEIDLKCNYNIGSLQTMDNKISWAGLYALSQRVDGAMNKFLGTQNLPAVYTGLNINIPVDTVFNGVSTTFTIRKNGYTAVKDVDYTLTQGWIKFHTMGTYSIGMSNPAIISYSAYPGRVVATFITTANADATLKSITLNQGILSPEFDSEITAYTAYVPDSISSISITGVATQDSAVVNGNVVNKALEYGNNIITLVITAPDKMTTKTYTITVIRNLAVTELNLSTNQLDLKVGDTSRLYVEIKPDNASNKTITWQSRNEMIASVDVEGLVTALDTGRVYIVATTEDGGFQDSCWVIITQPVTGISMIHTLTLNFGKTATITATVEPAKASNQTIIWQSRDETVAYVDTKGLVAGLKTGQVYIIATTQDGGFQDSCLVTVIQPVTGVTINPKTRYAKIGDHYVFNAIVKPSNADNKTVTWISRDSTIVSVDTSGEVIAKAIGATYIVITTQEGGFQDSCLVTVVEPDIAVTGVELNKHSLSLTVGESDSLIATVYPTDAINRTKTWVSSNESIATVDNAGKVTAVAVGEAYIVVTTREGGFQDSCLVTVTANLDGIAEISDKYIISIYPNPTHGELKILTEGLKVEKVQLFDLAGKKVYETQNTIINLSHLSNGVYTARIFTDRGVFVRKIVRE